MLKNILFCCNIFTAHNTPTIQSNLLTENQSSFSKINVQPALFQNEIKITDRERYQQDLEYHARKPKKDYGSKTPTIQDLKYSFYHFKNLAQEQRLNEIDPGFMTLKVLRTSNKAMYNQFFEKLNDPNYKLSQYAIAYLLEYRLIDNKGNIPDNIRKLLRKPDSAH